jgi:hypothetical protein
MSGGQNGLMTRFCCFIGMVLLAASGVRAASPNASEAPGAIRPAKVEITGRGFEIQELRMNALAFSNREYVWADVPPDIEKLLYTQMVGGGTAAIHLKAKEAGKVFVAVAASRMLDLKEQGWTLPPPDRSNTFTYTDVNRMMMVVLSHEVAKGEELDVPQFGWAGTIVLLPPDF